jgi:HemY protein
MMKNLMYFLGSLAVTLLSAFLLHYWLSANDDPGYVLIGFAGWSLETSMVVFAVSCVFGFFILYLFFRLLGWLMRLPAKMRVRGQVVKFNRSQEALISGLVDSAAGNWESAEKILIKHASNSGAPLLHYLTAARAAQSRGAIDKRDEYLRKAADESQGADIAVGLTQAELHLSEKQFDLALQTLSKLNSIDPKHATVLRLLHQTYQNIGDWEGLRKLLPALHKNKVLIEAEIKLLETKTFSRLLKQVAATGNELQLQNLWDSIPHHIQQLQDIFIIYFAAMINLGAGAKIEDMIVKKLSTHWHETLLIVFASIENNDALRQLAIAERWLVSYPDNAILLRVLGKISLRCQEIDKARRYLSKSLDKEPSVAAYQMLGDIFFQLDDKDKACKCYQQGLELAASEVVSNAEKISV